MITPTQALPPQGGGKFFSHFNKFPLSPGGRGGVREIISIFSQLPFIKGEQGGIFPAQAGFAGDEPVM